MERPGRYHLHAAPAPGRARDSVDDCRSADPPAPRSARAMARALFGRTIHRGDRYAAVPARSRASERRAHFRRSALAHPVADAARHVGDRQPGEGRGGAGGAERESDVRSRRNGGVAGVTRVVKVGGRPQADPRLAELVASCWARDAGSIVLVHGGGDEVSALQAALGARSTFVEGRRVTTAEDIDLVRMALSGSANKRLVATLVEHGVAAVGLSGEDAGLIGAAPMDAERLGYVGVPCSVNV